MAWQLRMQLEREYGLVVSINAVVPVNCFVANCLFHKDLQMWRVLCYLSQFPADALNHTAQLSLKRFFDHILYTLHIPVIVRFNARKE